MTLEEYTETNEKENRKQVMLDVAEGMKSVYWKHLERKVKGWIKAEEKYIDGFRRKGISQNDLEEYNQSNYKIRILNQFLHINEHILKENESYLARFIQPAQQLVNYVKTFVS